MATVATCIHSWPPVVVNGIQRSPYPRMHKATRTLPVDNGATVASVASVNNMSTLHIYGQLSHR